MLIIVIVILLVVLRETQFKGIVDFGLILIVISGILKYWGIVFHGNDVINLIWIFMISVAVRPFVIFDMETLKKMCSKERDKEGE